MIELILTRYVHFIGIIIVFALVFAENVMLKERLSRSEISRLFKVDNIYGLFSIIVVGAGLYLWLGIGKPADYYSQNHIFLTKVSLFILVGILSLWPSIFYFKNRKGDPDQSVLVPSKIRWIVKIELAILILIPLLATIMAQGVGLVK